MNRFLIWFGNTRKRTEIGSVIHKNCLIENGHHFARTSPDFKCLRCGGDYTWWFFGFSVPPLGECNGDEEYGREDECKRAADEEPEDGTEGTGRAEASDSNQGQEQEESTLSGESKHCMICGNMHPDGQCPGVRP